MMSCCSVAVLATGEGSRASTAGITPNAITAAKVKRWLVDGKPSTVMLRLLYGYLSVKNECGWEYKSGVDVDDDDKSPKLSRASRGRGILLLCSTLSK